MAEGKAMARSFGLTEPPMRAAGETTRSTATVSSDDPTATIIKGIGRIIAFKGKEQILIP